MLQLVLILLLSLPLFGEESSPVITVDVVDSGPWNNSYSALDAPRTKTWVRFRSPAIADLQDGERLRFWLQWATSLNGPWKVHTKGEMELLPSAKPRLKTRGYLNTVPNSTDEASLEMNPLTVSKWIEEALPYFRIAQAIRKPGDKWVKARKKMLAPEDNQASYSLPFEAKLDIVYVYLPDAKSKEHQSVPFSNIDILPGQPGPWSAPSFKQGPLPYISFFIALGGTNYGCVIPTHSFTTTGPAGKLEFWSCRNKPNGYRGTPIDDSSLDALWWGVAPVRVPMPPPGESTTLHVTTPLYGLEYDKVFTIHGPTATPQLLAERRINKVRYSNLLQRIDPNTAVPKLSKEDIALAKETALAAFQRQLELFQERGEQEAEALADVYISLLQVQQDEYLLRRSQESATPHDLAGEVLRDVLSTVAIAEDLQDWSGMKQQLDLFITTLDGYLSSDALSKADRKHYIFAEFGLRSLEPFQQGVTRGNFLEFLKTWAWTMSQPDTYAQALAIKVGSSEDIITPQEYRELAQLTMERFGNRDKAEEYWRKADYLLLDPDSPFYNPKADEGKLHMQRPGWWPE